MTEYIDKADLVKRLESRVKDYGRDCNSNAPIISRTYQAVLHMVENLPTADVVKVKHGEWVYWQPDGTNHLWSCSVCGGAISTPMKFVADHIKYCEHCGAKMDGERKCNNG